MKVIFLDIDGCLSSTETNVQIFKLTGVPTYFGPPKTSDFTREVLNWGARMVNILKMIVDNTGASIVIISTWGNNFPHPWQYQEMFAAYAWESAPVIDVIPKGDRIGAWLHENKCDVAVIIDDSNKFGPDLNKYHVRTNIKTGLTAEDAQKAIEILNRE